MIINSQIKYVSLNKQQPGYQIQGYYGGTHMNKFGQRSVTIYVQDSPTTYTPHVMAQYAGLRHKIQPTAAYVQIVYGGKAQNAKGSMEHQFQVQASPVPAGNQQAAQMMQQFQQHNNSLNQAAPAAPMASPQMGFPQQQPQQFGAFGGGFPAAAPAYTPPPAYGAFASAPQFPGSSVAFQVPAVQPAQPFASSGLVDKNDLEDLPF